jgi:hypothetical protein
MPGIRLSEIVPILQVAIGPVVLVSGVGLLLLTMTNRLGRIIDWTRTLVRELPQLTGKERCRVKAQLRILLKRAKLIRRAIVLAAVSVLFAAVLIIILFVTALFRLESAWIISLLFIACMGCLIASLAIFMGEINQALAALKLDIGDQPLSDS